MFKRTDRHSIAMPQSQPGARAVWCSVRVSGFPARVFPHEETDFTGGEGGIRTHGAHRSAVFKTAAFNRSATSPSLTGMTLGSWVAREHRILPSGRHGTDLCDSWPLQNARC